MPDVPGSSATTSTIGLGGSLVGVMDFYGDQDWYRITLSAGQQIEISMIGAGGSPMEDPYVRIRDASGNVLAFNDDGGAGRNARLFFEASSSGTYYIDAGAWLPDPEDYDPGYTATGTYQLSVKTYVPPSEATLDQIAYQLTTGYWDGGTHHFNVAQGGAITVNLLGLASDAQNLARHALGLWTDIIGISFVEVSGTAQITFDDDEDGAHASAHWSGRFTSSAEVNVAANWSPNSGSGLGTYRFQTFIHEIGHALGLGHAGDYNTTATYPFDASFANDGWPVSIMSYFSQDESSFYDSRGFSFGYINTPMAADIIAAGNLYGLSTTTRTGDTVYGIANSAYGTFANREVFNAALYPKAAVTIYDSGGTDTLNYETFSANQRIDLNAESFSNVAGRTGNLSIARGVIIENAVGGSGNDNLIGNSAANRLMGNAGVDGLYGNDGNDYLDGGTGNDYLYGGAGDDWIVFDDQDNVFTVDGGAGTDTLLVRNRAAPTTFDLAGRGFERAELLEEDQGWNSWTSIKTIYTISWLPVQRITLNDNSSWIVVDFDPSNLSSLAQVWNSYTSGGALASVDQLFDNGRRTFIDIDEGSTENFWQSWFAYDDQGRLDTRDLLYDNGTRLFINFDQANTESWSQTWLVYNQWGALDNQDLLFDNGTRTFINYDEAGTQLWSQNWFTFDSQSRMDTQDLLYDNNTRTFINYDQDNNQSWSQTWFAYDALGRLDTQDIINDDNSRTFYNFDQSNSGSWAWNALVYNSSGVLYQGVTRWDDGTTTYMTF